jgi:hypothetical protein
VARPLLRRTPVAWPPAWAIVYGVMGGVFGAGAMSVLRLWARRIDVVDEMVPQAVSEWLTARVGEEPPGGATGHHLLEEALHLGYGAAWGACTARRQVGPGASAASGMARASAPSCGSSGWPASSPS